jgi:hypothetical protein
LNYNIVGQNAAFDLAIFEADGIGQPAALDAEVGNSPRLAPVG